MKKLSEYQEKEIIELYTSGESIMTTSKKLGLSCCVVREFLSDNGITRYNSEAQKNAKKHAFSDEDITNIVNLYTNEHIGISKLSSQFHTTQQTIKKLLLENNVQLRDTHAANVCWRKCYNISAEIQAQIIDDYVKNEYSIAELVHKYNFTNKILISLLQDNNVVLRSKKEIYQIRDKKSIKHWQTMFGVNNPQQIKEVKQKTVDTCLLKYGATNGGASATAKEKIHNTMQKHYGQHYFATDTFKEVKEAIKQSKGYFPGQFGSPEHEQAMLAKYGKLRCGNARYFCDNYYFGSFPELALYLYCRDTGKHVIREPYKLTFIYNNQKFNYVPDFLIDGQLVEIKGEQFLAEDGSWRNPYKPELSALSEAKHQCAITNNVKILYANDYQQYIDWFKESGYIKDDFKC